MVARASLDPAGLRVRLPYAPPVSAKAAGVLAVVWGGATLLVDDLGRAVFAHGRWSLAGLAALVLGFRYLLGRYAFGAKTRSAATVRLALGEPVLLFAILAVHSYGQGRSGKWPGPLWAMPCGLIFAFPFVFGFVAALTYPVWRYAEAGSHEDADRAQVAAALWVLVPMALFTALGAILSVHHVSRFFSWTLLSSAVLEIALPLTVVALALARMRARRRWLTSVTAGKDPAWRIVESPAGTAALPALVRAAQNGAHEVLVRVHLAGQPFRSAERLEEVAVVARAPSP